MINTTSMAPVGNRVAEQGDRDVPPGEALAHDSRSHHGGEERGGAERFRPEAPPEICADAHSTRSLETPRNRGAGALPWSEEVCAYLGIPAAAVPGQVTHQGAHTAEVGAIHHPSPVALRAHESRGVKRSEVEREAGWGNAQRFGNLARGAAPGVRSEEEAEGPQSMGVGEGAETSDCSFLDHGSIVLEQSNCAHVRGFPAELC